MGITNEEKKSIIGYWVRANNHDGEIESILTTTDKTVYCFIKWWGGNMPRLMRLDDLKEIKPPIPKRFAHSMA